ncbi:DUF1330 domain-containing protein [Actinomadura craniellae]|uniref:DUF1330 domain-containing protein n=1 Tax=Actinomadura craniellae TaxID=2231787 RepID=A0A365HBB5_9ACTN|nr:DUF1330 domain-containing protein [Actinomadura craniellae]RAY16302.1 DUF1330 domain-containing protein [Actinomadura craniellae]
MPKAYVIFTEAIKDQAGMDAYGQAAASAMSGDLQLLAFDSQPQTLEGEWHGDRTVVLEFPSVEAARAWYESAEYQKAKALRQAAADTNAVIISGL